MSTQKTKPELAALWGEMDALRYVLRDLHQLTQVPPPYGRPWGLNELASRYDQRYRECYERYIALTRPAAAVEPRPPAKDPTWQSYLTDTPVTGSYLTESAAPRLSPAPSAAPATSAASATTRTAKEEPPPVRRAPRPTLAEVGRRFVTEHGILLISYAGAFLLIVATLLFQLYGPADMPNGLRLAAVAGLNLAFAVAAVICWHRAALRLVAASYTVIAALMWPLTLIAAYQYILRDATHLTPVTGVALATAACAVAYGLVARALDSRAYASLALGGLAASSVSSCLALGTGPSALPYAAVLASLMWLLARRPASPFALPAVVAGHSSSVAAVGAAIAWAATAGLGGSAPHFAYLPLTLLTISAAYALRYRLAHQDLDAVVAALLLSAAPVIASQSVGSGPEGVAAALVVVGLVTAALSQTAFRALRLVRARIHAADVATTVAWVAAIEVVSAGMMRTQAAEVHDAVLVAAAATGLVLVGRTRTAWWLATGLAALVMTAYSNLSPAFSGDSTVTSAPAYMPIALGAELMAVAIVGLARRDRRLAVPATLALVAATLTAGSAIGWGVDGYGMALLGVAGFTALGAWLLPVPIAGAAGGVARWRGLNNALAWLAALEAIGAALVPMSDPSLQLSLLGGTIACGLLLALSARSPSWLLTGGLALAAQTTVHATDIAAAAHAPAYVPASLGGSLVALIVCAIVHRPRWLMVPATMVLMVATQTASSALGWSLEGEGMALMGVAAATALAACVLPVRVGLPRHLAARLRGLDSAVAWLAALEAAGAALVRVSDPSLQFALLGAATGCGLLLALRTRCPWWLVTGGVALAAQASVHASSIATATHAPAYVPFTLGAVLATLVVTTIVQRNRWLTVATNLTLMLATITAGSTLGWSVDAEALATVGVALSAAVAARLIPSDRWTLAEVSLGRLGLANPLAWIAALEATGAGALAMSQPRIQLTVLAVATLCGLVCALVTEAPWWLLIGVAALGTQAGLHADAIAATGHLPVYVPVTLGVVMVASVAAALVQRDWRLVAPVNLCLTATAITANSAFGAGVRGYAIELVVLGWFATLSARLIPARGPRLLLSVGAGARFAAGALVVAGPAWAEAALIAAATAGVVHLAITSRRPEWLYLAGALFEWGWYWASATVGGLAPGTEWLATAFSAVPVVFTAAVATVWATLSRPRSLGWATPLALFAVLTAIAVDGGAIASGAWTLLAWSLFLDAAAIYLGARALRIPRLVYAAAACVVGGLFALLIAVAADIVVYPLGIASIAWAVRSLGRTAPAEADALGWRQAHLQAALVVAALAALAPVAHLEFASAHNSATMVEFATSMSLALMVWGGVSPGHLMVDRYAGVLMAGFAADWISVLLGTHEPQAYVLIPGVTLAACGVLLRHDQRLTFPPAVASGLVAIGAGGALATTLVQVIGAGDTSGYTAWLLLEGIAMICGAVAARQRLLGVLGSAAIAVAAVRALVTVAQVVPLYAVFGAAALLLLAIATTLANARSRVTEARHVLREAWSTWD